MDRQWHNVQNPAETGPREISAESLFDPESLWFDGHFPGMPILPGIAQLAMVSDLLKWHAKQRGEAVAIESLSRVRFRQFIRPGDAVTVTITREEDDPCAFKFKIVTRGQAACSGQVRTARRGG